MRYEPIDDEVVQQVIDGIHPKKDVEEITSSLGEWAGFLNTIITYVKQVIAELKTFFSGE